MDVWKRPVTNSDTGDGADSVQIPPSGHRINGNRHRTLAAQARSFTCSPVYLDVAHRRRTSGHGRAGRGNPAKKLKGPYKCFFAMRARRGPYFSIFRKSRIAVSLSGVPPVTYGTYRHKGFKYRPRSLRRAIILVLERRPSLTTREIASCCYCHGGPICRPGRRIPNESEMQATYRAVRHLVGTGRVMYVGRARRMQGLRTHKIYKVV